MNLNRFEEFSKTGFNEIMKLKQIIGITDEEVATIDHEQLGTSMPQGTKKARFEQFPTPRAAIKKLSLGDKRRMLERLYFEYRFLFSFAHGLPESSLFKTIFNN